MAKHYTSNFLLKYLYNETSLTQTLEIENAISEDESIQSQFKELKRGYKMLPKVKFYPTDAVMGRILNYSHQAAALDHSYN